MSNDTFKLSIVIPVYNEINTFMELYRRVQVQPYEMEIVIVDDGSTDGTRDILKTLTDENVKIFLNEKNRGKGYCIRRGFQEVTGDIVLIQDADLEYYPDEYHQLLKPILENKADAVYGSRFLGAHRAFMFWHYVGNLVINIMTNVTLNTNLSDMMTCYKAIRTSIAKKLVLKADRFGIEPEITAELFKRRTKVYEVPISYNGRDYREGKKIKWWDFFRCLYWLLRASLRKESDVGRDTLHKLQLMKHNNSWTFKKISPWLGERVLEIGSGIGTFSFKLAKVVSKLTVSDINESYISELHEAFSGNPNVDVKVVNAEAVDNILPNSSYDSVIALNLLEHVKDDKRAMDGMNSVLTNNGRLLIIVPAHPGLYGTLDREIGHYRRYTRRELINKIAAAGFCVEHIEYMNFLSVAGWYLNFCLLKRHSMSVPTLKIADSIIPLVAVIERFIRMPFGLSLFCVAKKIGVASSSESSQ